jgi:hypothetical protein
MSHTGRRRRGLLALTAAAVALSAVVVAASSGTAASSASEGGTFIGVFRETTPLTAVADGLKADTGITPASVMWFEAWSNKRAFPVQQARDLWNRGIMPHWTWEPWNPALTATDPAQITLQSILDGDWDAYISQRGAELASLGTPVMVRWGHEFNGNWYPWSTGLNGNDPKKYVRAYQHVHDLVTAAGATNVQWIWAYNNSSIPADSWNQPAAAYPGDAYVDWVGLDGYNWGNGPSWDPTGNHWSSFDGVIGDAYRSAVQIAPNKPVAIAEFGSSEDGGDKAAWLSTMFADLASGRYPKVRLLTYFDMLKEERWALTSSAAARNAFAAGATGASFQGTGTQLAQVARRATPTPTPTATPTPTPTPTPKPTPTPTPTPTPLPTTGPSGCRASLVVNSQWNAGFTGEIRVTNTSAAPIKGWSLGFGLPAGVTVQSGWNGSWSQQGQSVTVRDVGWNADVAAGATVSVGFVGNGTGPRLVGPVSFAGSTCTIS